MRAIRRHGGRDRYSAGRTESFSRPERRKLRRRNSNFTATIHAHCVTTSAVDCDKYRNLPAGDKTYEIAGLFWINAWLTISDPPQVKKPFPDLIGPMMASSVKEPFDSPDWIFETKLDGFRAIAVIDSAGKARIWSRNQLSLKPLSIDTPPVENLLRVSRENPMGSIVGTVYLDGRLKFSSQQTLLPHPLKIALTVPSGNPVRFAIFRAPIPPF